MINPAHIPKNSAHTSDHGIGSEGDAVDRHDRVRGSRLTDLAEVRGQEPALLFDR